MGSGCSTNQNCTYFRQSTPDSNITYTGPSISSLGICHGDYLNEVEAVILQKLIDYSTGVGINIPDIDLSACALFQQYLTSCGGCTDLQCLMKIVFNSLCVLYTDFTTLSQQITALLSGPYNTGCLTNLTTNPTLRQIIQELITEFCALKTQVDGLQNQLNGLDVPTYIGNFLSNALTSCQSPTNIISSTGSGSTVKFSFMGFTPPGGVIDFDTNIIAGSASWFDSTGLGRPNTPACGWAFCNGIAHTVAGITYQTRDLRENVTVCCGQSVMGGGALPVNASGANYPLGLQLGSATVTLTGAQSGVAPHSHGVNDPSHIHGVAGRQDSYKFGGDQFAIDVALGADTSKGTGFTLGTGFISPSSTGITIASSGAANAQQSHNNVQPSTALIKIVRLY